RRGRRHRGQVSARWSGGGHLPPGPAVPVEDHGHLPGAACTFGLAEGPRVAGRTGGDRVQPGIRRGPGRDTAPLGPVPVHDEGRASLTESTDGPGIGGRGGGHRSSGRAGEWGAGGAPPASRVQWALYRVLPGSAVPAGALVAIGACAVLVAAGAAQLLVTSATTEAVTSAEHVPNARMARL